MKICVINNIYPPFHRGGAEQVIVRSVEALLSDGHQVVLITSTPEKPSVEKKGKLTMYRIHPANLFFYTRAHNHSFISRALWHLIDMFHISVAKQVEDILKKEKPDVVHTHNLMGLSFLIPHRIRKMEMRHVHTIHDVQLVEPSAMILKDKEKSWRYNGLPTRMYSAFMRMLVGSPDVVVSPSQFLLDFYTSRKFFKYSKKVLLRNPATFDYAASVEKKTKGTFKFLYVGQIEHHKGILTLVEAFLQFVQTGADAQLHIVGRGSQDAIIHEYAKKDHRIHIHGYVERKDLPSLFQQMNITVVPSLCYENSPTVIFESMACNVPVLASNIEGIAELITEGENGMTFEAGNIRDLAQKLKWCVHHRDMIESMKNKIPKFLLGLSEKEYTAHLTALYQK